ncbi:MAG: histidine phosphatase family protein [Chloroflexi bacterium]|nr:histidine phosphatase family protein [Chloroflexota bacterium]
MSVEKVLLIRHGETDFNRERRLQGVMQIPLNERGRNQAHSVARYLKGLSIDALYTSPILRAHETAEIIGNCIGLPPHSDERLREIEFGLFEGLTFGEVEDLFPAAHHNWSTGYLAFKAPEGESRHDVQRRMRAAWDDLTANADHKTIALVSHGSAIAIFLGSMYAILPDTSIKNTSITTLKRREEIWEILGYAELPHWDES